ncbi:MAG: 2-oxoacid:acceptor oxidoreductase family protein [Bacillota bacterium]
MKIQLLISGFGGQGVLTIGQLLAYAGLMEGKNVAWVPSYGPEMRGGTAHCWVTVADGRISSPIGDEAYILIALNQPSLDKFLARVKKDGIVIVNASMISSQGEQDDPRLCYIPTGEITESLGNGRAANMVLLGAALALGKVFSIETVAGAMLTMWPDLETCHLNTNRRALEAGYDWAVNHKCTHSAKMNIGASDGDATPSEVRRRNSN